MVRRFLSAHRPGIVLHACRSRRAAHRRPVYLLHDITLEGRLLLASPPGLPLAVAATPIVLGSVRTGTLHANDVLFFRIDPAAEGELTVLVHAPGGSTRLSLLNAQGQAVLTSDGQAARPADDLIQISVSAGTEYLELQNLAGPVAFALTTRLMPASAPLHSIALGQGPDSVVAGDFNGDGRTDLAITNEGNGSSNSYVSVLIGNGDGTFQPQKTYAVGNSPAALVTGDFNGDGHTDLAVADEGSDAVSILLGNGDGTFQDRLIYATGPNPYALVAGDFNRDGRTDLAVADEGAFDPDGNPIQGTGSLSVLLGNGDGSFQDQQTYAAGTNPVSVVAGDFNGDGYTDLAAADLLLGRVLVLSGRGNGTFSGLESSEVGKDPIQVVTGDFNDDHRLDLAVANQGDGTVSVLAGRGDGTFQRQMTSVVGSTPNALTDGDFNGDGSADLAVANYGSDDVSVLLGNGNGSFHDQRTFAVGYEPSAIAVGDFNRDGRADLAVTNLGLSDLQGTPILGTGTLSVLPGVSDGRFQDAVNSLAPSTAIANTRPTAIAAGDLNGDGITDLAVANYGSFDSTGNLIFGSGYVSVLLGNGDGSFQSPLLYAVGSNPSAIVAADLNGDGLTDLAITNDLSSDVLLLLNIGDASFEAPRQLATGSYPKAIVASDFNGDGSVDLAIANEGDDTVSVLLGNGDGSFQDQVTSPTGPNPISLAAGDFNGDGMTDLAVADYGYYNSSGAPILGTGDLSVLLGNGDGSFATPKSYAVGSNPISVVAADFNGDRRADLAVANHGSGTVSVLLGNGNGSFQGELDYVVGDTPYALVPEDSNGDGNIDLAVANYSSNDVSILLDDRDGTFHRAGNYSVGNGPIAIVAGDYDGDDQTDLAIADYNSGDISVLLGGGDGGFQSGSRAAAGTSASPTVLYLAESNSTGIASGDFNGDGRMDLAVTSQSTGDISVFLGNGDGSFQDPVVDHVGQNPNALVAADFNGDGRTDLAVADFGPAMGEVSVLLGNGDGTFQQQVTYAAGSGPNSIVTGDFNGDGRIDLAVANEGNYDDNGDLVPGPGTVSEFLGNGDGSFQDQRLYPAGLNPSALVTGDFNGDGRTDLAIADNGSDQVSVLLSSAHGPYLRTFAVGSGSAGIVAGDFNRDGFADLAVANQNDATVSVLLGNGDGSFKDQTLFAVGSDPNSIVAGDFNDDGSTDLAIANQGAYDDSGNLIPGTGDVSVLLANGNGSFQPQVLYAAGANANALVAGDFNGDHHTDLAIANYRPGGALVLQNRGDGTFVNPALFAATPHASPVVADLNNDGIDDVIVVNAAGQILYRQGLPGESSLFRPPVTVNPGHAARDVAVLPTPFGLVLAAADVADTVSFYRYSQGMFERVGVVATGTTPAQVIVGDLLADGGHDLLIRNAGDGTLTLVPEFDVNRILSVLSATGPTVTVPVGPTVTVPVGIGASDVALLDTTGRGVLDLVVTDKLTGEVSVYRNMEGGRFAPPDPYRAGVGIAQVDSAGLVTSMDAPASVAPGVFTVGRAADLLVANPGSNSLGLLTGLAGGRFANAVAVPTTEPAQVVRVADLNHDGISDVAVLGDDVVSIYLGNGQGAFLPSFAYNAGLAPTGLTVADIKHDGQLDLIIGNEYGDVLVLTNQGNGRFRPLLDAGQSVALAVADLTGAGTKDIIYASQNLDRVVVDYGGGQRASVGDSSGLLAPGAVKAADLNGDGIDDLIVANSGGNNVLVYPGLGNGQFGPALNGGKGFFTGTDPVGVTIADLNGRPDLIIADRGSNDITILLNEPTSGGAVNSAGVAVQSLSASGSGFTFVPGPRLNLKTAAEQGIGPVSTTLVPSPTGGPASLAVSLSGSDQVWMIPGVGGGFFNDRNPRVFKVGSSPGPIFFGPFDGLPDLLSINSGSNDITLISDVTSADSRIAPPIGSGGIDPTTAFAFESDNGFESLVVGNQGDGILALFLGGPDGLSPPLTMTNEEVPSPTALVFSVITGGRIEFFAASAGRLDAIPLAFDLDGLTVPEPIPAPPPSIPQLVPLRESSLSLVGTLLVLTIQTPTSEAEFLLGDSVVAAAAADLETGLAPSAGQSIAIQASPAFPSSDPEPPPNSRENPASDAGEAIEPPAQAAASWKRYLLGLDEPQEWEHPGTTDPEPAILDGQPDRVVPWQSTRPGPAAREPSAGPDHTAAVDEVMPTLIPVERGAEEMSLPGAEIPSEHSIAASAPAHFDHATGLPAPELLPGRRFEASLSALALSIALSRVFPPVQAQYLQDERAHRKAWHDLTALR